MLFSVCNTVHKHCLTRIYFIYIYIYGALCICWNVPNSRWNTVCFMKFVHGCVDIFIFGLINSYYFHRKHSKTRQIWGIWKLRPAYSPETPNLGQNLWCFVPCDLEIWWPWKTIGHLSFAVSSFVQHFIAIGEFKLELQSGNAQCGSNSAIFRAVWPWNLPDDLEKQ